MKAALETPEPLAALLAALPDGRRPILQAVHDVIRTAAPTLQPAVWNTMIGYGSYHYRYASGREGDWFVIGLANQKRYVSLYLCATVEGAYLPEANAQRLGKVSVGQELHPVPPTRRPRSRRGRRTGPRRR